MKIYELIENGQFGEATDLFEPLPGDLLSKAGNWEPMNYREKSMPLESMPFADYLNLNVTKALYGIPDEWKYSISNDKIF